MAYGYHIKKRNDKKIRQMMFIRKSRKMLTRSENLLNLPKTVKKLLLKR